MTPQTISNDLEKRICDPLDIVLLVIGAENFISGNHPLTLIHFR